MSASVPGGGGGEMLRRERNEDMEERREKQDLEDNPKGMERVLKEMQ